MSKWYGNKVEDTFKMGLNALTQHVYDSNQNGPISEEETYQLLCTREIVRGMLSARLLAESVKNPMQQDELHELASKMLDVLTHVYPAMGLATSSTEALEELSRMSSVSAWKMHTRILSLLKPEKKERPFPIPFWPSYKAA